MPTSSIYCGNNSIATPLLNGTARIGTNYECLRKGIGKGRSLPYDVSFNVPRIPIDSRRFYCGEKRDMPTRYFARGSPSKCLAVGIGIGKSQRLQGRNNILISVFVPFFIYTIAIGLTFLILIVTKIGLKKNEKDGKTVVDWEKMIPYMLVSTLIFIMILMKIRSLG